MSKKADGLIANMLSQRWQDTTTVANATVSAKSPASPTSQSRQYIDTLVYSIRNFVGSGGAQATVAVQIRHASVQGTVIASFANLIAASTAPMVSLTGLNYQSKRGGQLFVTTDTFVASLTAAVNAAGWTEDVNG
jgi:hypothetical protein